MIGHYKDEMSQIHAPTDLISRTRLKMQQEQQRLQDSGSSGRGESDRRGRYIALALPFAAAVVLMVVIPFTLGHSDSQTEIGKEYLGKKEQPEITEFQSQDSQEVSTDTDLTVTKTAELPEEFQSAELTRLEDYSYCLSEGDGSSQYRAYAQKDENGYLITGTAKSQSEFIEKMDAIMMEIE